MVPRASEEPEVLAFDATVERGGEEVVLSETYFYPEGGGQPADCGEIGGYDVVDVRTEGGRIVHVLDGRLETGESVTCAIDPEFRRYCMCAHTASHALYGAGRRLFDELGYGGFGITDEKVRVDFETPTEIDDETLVELERLVNRCVWEARPVGWETVPREAALSREDVAFNAKTEEGAAGDSVRIVEIEGWDVAACGGTHVSNTREIGPVSVLERSNPGEGLTRVEFAVGVPGIAHRTTEKRVALEAAVELGTALTDVPEAIARLDDERRRLEEERDALVERALQARLQELTDGAFERDGKTWLAGVIDLDVDVETLTEQVRSRPDGIDVAVLVTPEGRLAIGTDGDPDASSVVAELTDRFGGGGGGSESVAQGGGLTVDGETVLEYVRSREG